MAALLCCTACGQGAADPEAERPSLGEEQAVDRAAAMLDSRPADPADAPDASPPAASAR